MGKKTKIKLGGVIMDAVVSESVDFPADVTNKPVEKGEDIADHMKAKPFVAKLSGSMVDDAAGKLEILKQYQKDAVLLTYVGRTALSDVVITSLNTKHPVENAEGFDYDITLTHVKIAKPETFKVTVKNPETNKQDKKTASKVKDKTNEGRKQVKSK